VDDLQGCGGESCLVYLRSIRVKLRRDLLLHAASVKCLCGGGLFLLWS